MMSSGEHLTSSGDLTSDLRKKTSLGESLAGSHVYYPIRDSRRDS